MTCLDELIQFYRLLCKHRLNDSHSGNASISDAHGMWITPTGACAETVTKSDLVYCPHNQSIPDNASRDSMLHRAIYSTRPDARVVLHAHPSHALALTLNGLDFTPEDFEGNLYFGTVPVVSINYDTWFSDSAEKISKALLDNNIVIARGHGVYSCSDSMEQAFKWISSLESSAHIAAIEQALTKNPDG
ncbi:MAG: class II aldolase/adducin family protein [Gammaproteobacteria bacterium]|nr:class II aldolase/adducin family protein [Gammaproteobacteria bacterium]